MNSEQSRLRMVYQSPSPYTSEEFFYQLRREELEIVREANSRALEMATKQLQVIEEYRKIINYYAGTTWTKHANEEIEFVAANWLEDGIL